jgi:hypothetical protein
MRQTHDDTTATTLRWSAASSILKLGDASSSHTTGTDTEKLMYFLTLLGGMLNMRTQDIFSDPSTETEHALSRLYASRSQMATGPDAEFIQDQRERAREMINGTSAAGAAGSDLLIKPDIFSALITAHNIVSRICRSRQHAIIPITTLIQGDWQDLFLDLCRMIIIENRTLLTDKYRKVSSETQAAVRMATIQNAIKEKIYGPDPALARMDAFCSRLQGRGFQGPSMSSYRTFPMM